MNMYGKHGYIGFNVNYSMTIYEHIGYIYIWLYDSCMGLNLTTAWTYEQTGDMCFNVTYSMKMYEHMGYMGLYVNYRMDTCENIGNTYVYIIYIYT